MTRTTRVGVGMIGAGSISDYHLQGLQACPEVEIRSICGRTTTRAECKAVRYGVQSVTTHWEEVVDRSDVDAVVIATPDVTHHEIALAAIDKGKAVLVQKPMAVTVDDAEAMVKAAEENSVPLSVAFMHRYLDETIALERALDGGRLGDVQMIRIRNATPGAGWAEWFYKRPERGMAGVAMQLGTHGIDLLLHLFGPIEYVSGFTGQSLPRRHLPDGRVVESEIHDYALAYYRLGEIVVSHEMSYSEVAGCDRFRLEVYGSKGTAWLRHPTRGIAIFADLGAGERGWFHPELPGLSAGERQHAAFVDQILGRSPDDQSGRDAVFGLRVVEALCNASDALPWKRVDGTGFRSG